MRRMVTACAMAGLGLALAVSAGAQDTQQKAAAVKQAAAQNQQALRSYSWMEKTEIVFKGEVKNTKVEACRYGPDGKVQKTLVTAPPPAEKKRGLRGKMVEKKTGEMKEDMEAAAALVHQYLPPSPEKIQAAMAAGKITIVPSAATTTGARSSPLARSTLTPATAPFARATLSTVARGIRVAPAAFASSASQRSKTGRKTV